MYGECQACEHKKMPMIVKDGTQEVSWKKWKTIKENRILKNNATKEITLTVKHEEKGTLHELMIISMIKFGGIDAIYSTLQTNTDIINSLKKV